MPPLYRGRRAPEVTPAEVTAWASAVVSGCLGGPGCDRFTCRVARAALRDAAEHRYRRDDARARVRPVADWLVTPPDIAERLERPLGTVRDWCRAPDFPEPLRRGGRGQLTLYWWPQVEAWLHGRRLIPEDDQ